MHKTYSFFANAKRHLRALMILAAVVVFVGLPVRAAEGYFDSNGVKIRYVTEGTGEAVVLIHGWMSDSRMWGEDAAGETKLTITGTTGFQFIAIDSRGHGKSDKPHDVAKYGMEMAEDIVRLLDHLKIKKAHLVGYSSGAYIAGKVVGTYPKRVLSVLYAGQAPVMEGGKASDFSETDAFSKAVEANDVESYLIDMSPANLPKPTREQAGQFAKYIYAGKDLKALAAAGNSFRHLIVTDKQLRKSKAPVIFIYGANESGHVKSQVAKAHKLLGRGEIKIIPDANHMTAVMKPEFGKSLINFLNASRVSKP